MERDQFTFYRSFWDATKALPKKDQLSFLTAICSYAFGDDWKPPTGSAYASFLLVKPILDKAAKKAANGKQKGIKSKANQKQNGSKQEANDDQTENNKEGDVEGDVEGENECSLSPLPPLGKESAEKKQDPFSVFAGDDKDLLHAFREFEKMRVKLKKPLTDHAKELTIADLKKLSANPAEWVAILDQSVQRSWQGVFALKSEASQPAKQKVPYGSAGSAPLGDLEQQALAKMLGGKQNAKKD